MNVNAQKFQSQYALVCKPLAQSNHRTTLPQSALAGCQLPQGGSRVGWHHSTRRPKTARFRAIFIAPTKLRGFWLSPFIGRHSLSEVKNAPHSRQEKPIDKTLCTCYNTWELTEKFPISYRGVEQLEARRAHNPEVVGSSPASATKKIPGIQYEYRDFSNF